METNLLPLTEAGFIALTLLCLAFVLLGTRLTFSRMGMAAPAANRRTAVVAAGLIGWLGFAGALAANGILGDFTVMPPRLLLVIVPPLVVALVLTFSARTQNFLAHVPHSWLLYLQVFRVPVEIFLWLLFLENLIPVQMTFEGRNWDVLTGITAPVVAFICFAHGRKLKAVAIAWNLLGLALLLNIVVTAILSTPVPFRYFMNEPANTIVAYFPVVFLPAFLVPLAYTLHFFSLRKLLQHEPQPDNARAKKVNIPQAHA